MTASAADVSSDGSTPDCTLQMCTDNFASCGSSATLQASYAPYTYTFDSGPSDSSTVVTLNFTCYTSASVGLESVNLAAAASAPSAQPASTVYNTITETSTVTSKSSRFRRTFMVVLKQR